MLDENFAPTIVDWPKWETVTRELASQYPGPSDPGEFILIGHSYGADDAVRMARLMNDFNMPVKLLFLLDATSPDPIPPNVELCIHYYEPWPPGDFLPYLLSGNPVVPAPDNTRTQIINLHFNREALGDGVGCANHFSVDVNQLMHNIILKQMFELLSAPPNASGSKPSPATASESTEESSTPWLSLNS
jgi:pimeloyl-ACP methyl ester carboxylesterase